MTESEVKFLYLRGVNFNKANKIFQTGKITVRKGKIDVSQKAIFEQNNIDPNNIFYMKSPNGKNSMYILTGGKAELCINCSKKMDTVKYPLGLPIDYKDDIYICVGQFLCDYGCLFRYLEDHKHDSIYETSLPLANNMFQNDHPGQTPMAKPDRETYKVYGGSLDLEGVIQLFERKPFTGTEFMKLEFIAKAS